MKRYFRYSLVNGVFALSIYYGLFIGNENMANIAYFMAWVLGLCSCFVLDSKVKQQIRDAKPSVPLWFDSIFNIIVVVCFTWVGAFITATVYGLGSILVWGAVKDVRK